MSLKHVKDKKNKTDSSSLSSVDDTDNISASLAGYESKQLKQMIHDQLLAYTQQKKLDKKTFTELTEIVSEFLNCFVILGYNCTGEPVTLVSCKSQQHADSLGTLVQRFIATTPGPSDFDPPNDPSI